MLHTHESLTDTIGGPSLDSFGNRAALGSALVLFESNPPFKHYASELLPMLGLESLEELLEPMARARAACLTAGIPENRHFKPVFRFHSPSVSLRPDYKLTPLAAYLVTINADPTNVNVAKAQVFFFLKNNR